MYRTRVDEGVEGFTCHTQWDYRSRVYHTSEFGHHNTDYLRAMFNVRPQGRRSQTTMWSYLTLQLANTYGNGIDKAVA